jgi:NAD(P)-dependent dehydrogenase (short-subunit alcohol dehydrogenase family)
MLQDKVIIVTGSTTGIGRAIARRCVELGAQVLVHGRDAARGQALVDALAGQAAWHEDDLADADAPTRIVQAAVDQFGRLDGVVNNAAWVVRSDLESTDARMFDQVMAVNVRAPFLMIKAALPYLKQTRGCVANIGSVNEYAGEVNLFPYSVSKGALETLSRNLAGALAGQGVRIFHFVVGWVLTDNEYHYKIADGLAENWPERIGQTMPAGRMTRPEEIARAVCFWMSDETYPFSGTVLELEQYPFWGRNPSKSDS